MTGTPDQIFEQLLGSPDRVPKLLRGLLGHAPMTPPVRGDFVTGLHDHPHQFGVTLGDPAQNEERRLRPVLV